MHSIEFHLLRLDMLCVNASCLLSISDMWIMQCHVFSQLSYMWIMHCHGARHHICELSHAIFFSLRIPFVDNMCILNYSSCVSAIWAGYGKIWSENKVFRAGNGTCWSIYLDGHRELLRGGFRGDDQTYIPPEVYALSCNVYISHMMHMVSCIA